MMLVFVKYVSKSVPVFLIMAALSLSGFVSSQATIKESSQKDSLEVSFSGVSITGQGPVGIELKRTSDSEVSFELLNVEGDESVISTSANATNGIMEIKVTSTGNNSTVSLNGADANGNPVYLNVVRVYIPDISYSSFDILSASASNYLYVKMEDFAVPDGVKIDIKDGTFILKDITISRSNYNIKVNRGSLSILANTVITDINANLVEGGALGFHLYEMPTNIHVDSSQVKPFVTRPNGWGSVHKIGKGTPKITLASGGGVASIKVGE